MNIQDVRDYMKEEEHYVMFRLPNEKMAYCISSPHIRLFDTFPQQLSSLRNSFVFAPFSTQKHPILVLPMVNKIQLEMNETLPSSIKRTASECEPSADYCLAFQTFVSAVKAGKFQKLVLSRAETISVPTQDPIQLFQTLCAKYQNAMVYYFHSHHTGNWLGATPELLLSGDDVQLRTIALAGTVRNQGEMVVPLSNWGEKERLEQSIVADFIRNHILSFGQCKDEWGPYSVSAGHISHLRTDFYFTMNEDQRTSFINAIHPTPAVCGIPQEESMAFILANEGVDRGYYAGFLGTIEEECELNLYVNLRCMNFTDKSATLYAGGGILPTSDLQSEWNETEEKMNTLKTLLF